MSILVLIFSMGKAGKGVVTATPAAMGKHELGNAKLQRFY